MSQSSGVFVTHTHTHTHTLVELFLKKIILDVLSVVQDSLRKVLVEATVVDDANLHNGAELNVGNTARGQNTGGGGGVCVCGGGGGGGVMGYRFFKGFLRK